MNIYDLKQCPFCGSEEYYTKEAVRGVVWYNERFDGKEADNENMYSGLTTISFSGNAYCRNCDKLLGNLVSEELSKQCMKEIGRRGIDD